jgi:PfaD family protein
MVVRSPSSDTGLGWWSPNGSPPITEIEEIREAIARIHRSVTIVRTEDGLALGSGGISRLGATNAEGGVPIVGYASALPLGNLGDASFCADHRIRYPYVTGAMANGIASAEVVEAMGNAGMLGFFGAAGLPPDRVASEIDRIQAALGDKPYGFNLIHSPNEPDIEAEVASLYLERGVRLVEASAYLGLTLPVVRYRVTGIHRDAEGFVVAPNRIVAKVSRVEVATKFLSPPPKKFLDELVNAGEITTEQAEMAEEIPMAQDLTAEADSGGHTDNRPAMALLPALLALAERIQSERNYAQPLRVGAAGGLSTPASLAAAFAMGAAYVVTGSVNQACVEAGTSEPVRKMLAAAQQADVAMAPAADMFEMGVKVQVLKRGTLFPMRAQKLFELYRAYDSMEAIPANEREKLEKQFFRSSLEEAWNQTRSFFEKRDPTQNERAARDPRHKMALVFRSYLGQSSTWANSGDPTRIADYQIWCGPAMGAFNEWVKESFLEGPENRSVVILGLNLLYGAALTLRLNTLRTQGIRLPAEAARCRPLTEDALALAMSE